MKIKNYTSFLKYSVFNKPLGIMLISALGFLVAMVFFYNASKMIVLDSRIIITPKPQNPEFVIATIELLYFTVSMILIVSSIALWQLKNLSRYVVCCLISLVMPAAIFNVVTDTIFFALRWPFFIMHLGVLLSEIYFIYFLLCSSTSKFFEVSPTIIRNSSNFITITQNNTP